MNKVQESIIKSLIDERKDEQIQLSLHSRCNMLDLKEILEEILESCKEDKKY